MNASFFKAKENDERNCVGESVGNVVLLHFDAMKCVKYFCLQDYYLPTLLTDY